MEQVEHTAEFQGLEALDPSLGLIFPAPSQGLALARQCIILEMGIVFGPDLHLGIFSLTPIFKFLKILKKMRFY